MDFEVKKIKWEVNGDMKMGEHWGLLKKKWRIYIIVNIYDLYDK
jgi:hypothetical protein